MVWLFWFVKNVYQSNQTCVRLHLRTPHELFFVQLKDVPLTARVGLVLPKPVEVVIKHHLTFLSAYNHLKQREKIQAELKPNQELLNLKSLPHPRLLFILFFFGFASADWLLYRLSLFRALSEILLFLNIRVILRCYRHTHLCIFKCGCFALMLSSSPVESHGAYSQC